MAVPRSIAFFVLVLFALLFIAVQSQGYSAYVKPENNPESYPWAQVVLIREEDDVINRDNLTVFQAQIGQKVGVILNFNVVFETTAGDYVDSAATSFLRIMWGINADYTAEQCKITGPETTTSDILGTGVTATVAFTSTISVTKLPAAINPLKLVRVSCAYTIETRDAGTSNVISQIIAFGQPLPLYVDSNELMSIRAESIRLRRSDDQTHIHPGLKSVGFEKLDPNPLFIPIDRHNYRIDIHVDVLASTGNKYFFAMLPARNVQSPPFIFSDLTSMTCTLPANSPSYCPTLKSNPLTITVVDNNIVIFAVDYTDCPFTCSTFIKAVDVYISTIAQGRTENPELYIPIRIGLGTSSTVPSVFYNYPDPGPEVEPGSSSPPPPPSPFLLELFPIGGIIDGESGLYETPFPPNDATTIPGTTKPWSEVYDAPDTINQGKWYDLLDEYQWAISFTAATNEVALTFERTDAQNVDDDNFPYPLFVNVRISMQAFAIYGIAADGGGIAGAYYRGVKSKEGLVSNIIVPNVGISFDPQLSDRPFPFETLSTFFSPEPGSAVRSGSTVSYTFKYWLTEPQDTDRCNDLAGCPWPELSVWENTGSTYRSQQKLLVNGKLVLPKTPMAEDPLYSRIELPIPDTPRPGFAFYTSVLNSAGVPVRLTPSTTRGDLDPSSPEADQLLPGIESGTNISFTFEFDPGVRIQRVDAVTEPAKNSTLAFVRSDFDPQLFGYLDALSIPGDFNYQTCSLNVDPQSLQLQFCLTSDITNPASKSVNLIYGDANIDFITFPTTGKQTCHFNVVPAGLTTVGAFVQAPDFRLLTPMQAWMPPILARASTIGIQHTRPYFLNQINFGTLSITSIPRGVSSIRLFYRDIQFRPDDASGARAFYCLNEDSDLAESKYTGTISTTVVGTTSTFGLNFDEDSLTLLRDHVATHPNIICSSIPLIVQKYNGAAGLLQIVTDTDRSAPFIQFVSFPPTYAMRLTSKLTPGRVSTITFTVQSSIPGKWLINLPYSLDLADNTECISTVSTDKLADITYLSEYTDCIAWGLGSNCYETFGNALLVESKFKMLQPVAGDEAQEPLSCTFVATRRFSTPTDTNTMASIIFPDATVYEDENNEKVKGFLANFKVSALLPAIGYLPPIIEFSLVTVALQTPAQLLTSSNPDTTTEPKNFDILHIDIYNAEFPQSTEIVLTSISPLTTSEAATFATTCVHGTDAESTNYPATSGGIDFFLSVGSAPGTNGGPSTLTFKFEKELKSFERLSCDLFFPYSTLPLKRPQTAILTTKVGPADSQTDYSAYLYLPPITSSYAIEALSDPDLADVIKVSGTTGQFGFIFANTGKSAVQNPEFFIPFSAIGLVPVNDNEDSTFACTTTDESQNVSPTTTQYSRLTDYTLRIKPLLSSFTPNTKYTLKCTFDASNGIGIVDTVQVVSTLYEPESGQYNLAPYTFRYVPAASINAGQAAMVLRWVNPSPLAANAIPASSFPTAVASVIQLLAELSLETETELTTNKNLSTQDATILRAAATQLQALARPETQNVLLTRFAHFRQVTSLTDSLATPGATRKIDASQIQDIATVATYTPLFTTGPPNEWTLVSQVFSSVRAYWTSYAPLVDKTLRPLDSVGAYQPKWQKSCFTEQRCGIGCPVACSNNQPCTTDFQCESNFCAVPTDSSSKVCLTKDFSLYPATFFSEYRVKK